MKKYEEKRYQYQNIKKQIYPIIRNCFFDHDALNGKHLSERDTAAVQFAGDMLVLFAIQRGEGIYEILKDAMLPPEVSVEEVFETACENLAGNIEFVIGNTWYGAYAIVADGNYEASSLCLKHIWQVCADKLKEDLIICAPAKDFVLFAPASQMEVLERMRKDSEQAYKGSKTPVSRIFLRYRADGKGLETYGM